MYNDTHIKRCEKPETRADLFSLLISGGPFDSLVLEVRSSLSHSLFFWSALEKEKRREERFPVTEKRQQQQLKRHHPFWIIHTLIHRVGRLFLPFILSLLPWLHMHTWGCCSFSCFKTISTRIFWPEKRVLLSTQVILVVLRLQTPRDTHTNTQREGVANVPPSLCPILCMPLLFHFFWVDCVCGASVKVRGKRFSGRE